MIEYLRIRADGSHEPVWICGNTCGVTHDIHQFSYYEVHHCHCYTGADRGEDGNDFEGAVEGLTIGKYAL